MKRIYLVRHGKSDWDDLNLNDIERPLKERGVMNSHEMGEHLKELKWVPELIMSSPAVRAYETAKIIAEQLDITGARFKVDSKLYLPDFPTVLKIILYLSDDLESIMIIGHEPSLSNLINHFLHTPIEAVVTGSLTAMDFKVKKWRDISPDNLAKAVHKSRHDMSGKELS
ncbi:MAG: histidine phosphatase family protein [Flavobacteriales bacterium]|nr:histidine phosphatase family protein [Flavobacteriales bacterium]